jgi:hypothetical protein
MPFRSLHAPRNIPLYRSLPEIRPMMLPITSGAPHVLKMGSPTMRPRDAPRWMDHTCLEHPCQSNRVRYRWSLRLLSNWLREAPSSFKLHHHAFTHRANCYSHAILHEVESSTMSISRRRHPCLVTSDPRSRPHIHFEGPYLLLRKYLSLGRQCA